MKILSLILILNFLVIFQMPVWGQDQTVYKARMLVGGDKDIEDKPVEISLEEDRIKIRQTKKPFTTKYILFTDIENAEYTYSNRPRYTAATLGAIAFGLAALPVFFMKTKKNWLTINAEKNSSILQLQSENYRMLLLAMDKKGIKISDAGDRDEQEKDKKNTEKNNESEKTENK